MANVRTDAEPMSIFMDDDDEYSMLHHYNDSFDQVIEDVEHEPLSQSCVNYPTATVSSAEYSQGLTSSVHVAVSSQPSPELLSSLGIKVRDFAYEKTLPAIVPVPRVPRQVQPAPQTLKRSQREWDGEGEGLQDPRPVSGKTPPKKSRSLERKPTEPLEETAVGYTRTLERIAFPAGYSIVRPSTRTPSPPTSCRPTFINPTTSPSTPPLSHLASQDSELVQTPSAFPGFVVDVADARMRMRPAEQLEPALQTAPIHLDHLTGFPSDSALPPIVSSPSDSPLYVPRDVSPSHLMDPSFEITESGRGRPAEETGFTTPSIRYHLRKRPTVTSHAAFSSRRSRVQSRTSKSVPRRK